MHHSYMYMRYIRVLHTPVITISSTRCFKKSHTQNIHERWQEIGDYALPLIGMLTFQFQNIGFKISRHLTYECEELKMLAYQQFIELSIFITAKPV
jgi:hypothetical protein